MINGIINVYKQKGYTSFDVVAIMRGILGQKKVGHTGTLDPDAEGVLPVCAGNATKLCDMLTDKSKEYVATFVLGKKTDTLDISGKVLEEREPKVSIEDLKTSINSFIGGYNQYPPMYSAKKINGKKLYELARDGKEVERKPVFVEIIGIETIDISYPYVTIKVACSKGTYIRSLCEDIGAKCGELACMTSLKRTRVGNFTIDKALTLDEITGLKNEGKLLNALTPTDFAFLDKKEAKINPQFRKLLDNGNKLSPEMLDCEGVLNGEAVRVYNDDNEFVGLYTYEDSSKIFKPFKMFIGE
ncbi:MAG: tRNA pseudouridine(55) synthase TruB [Lachnospiraceae bacterium]|nr:tRNA pseudouridine(55) synthase TruB [Lachnospiraceae bacterium]